MDQPVDPISEADLHAYVDDALPPARRIEVEAHLARHPAEATRVMADLRVRDELRLALAEVQPMGRPATAEAARRLQRALGHDRLLGRLRKVAAVALLIGTGWLAHAEFGALRVNEVSASALPPAYVGDALRAHRTALLRAGMHSQPEVHAYDPAEIRAATAIVMPALPDGWKVTDVQVFPSTFGPSVAMRLRTPQFGTVSLFAVRPGGFNVVTATLAHDGDLAAAYWQVGEVAYALVARGDAGDLDTAATQLARSLY